MQTSCCESLLADFAQVLHAGVTVLLRPSSVLLHRAAIKIKFTVGLEQGARDVQQLNTSHQMKLTQCKLSRLVQIDNPVQLSGIAGELVLFL